VLPPLAAPALEHAVARAATAAAAARPAAGRRHRR
jgi:hypothetical protein